MKIGVVTFWHGNENYGMMLQCWALQEYLKEQGHEPFVIRCVPSVYKTKKRHFIELFSGYLVIRFLYRKLLYIRNLTENRKKNNIIQRRGFFDFRQKYLRLSKRYYTTLEQIQKNPPQADCYIVGSDQVWSQTLDNINNQIYYLNFGSKEVKRVAYAPSFGLPTYPKNLRMDLKNCLSRFDAISVRENIGVEICKNVGFKATKVLDPTLLLTKEHYLNLCNGVNKNLYSYIFLYCLNISSSDDVRWAELKDIADNKNARVIVTPGKGYLSSAELFDDDIVEYSYATVSQWLEHIANSTLVVTTSFHGIVFSILLEKNFVFVPLQGQFAHTNNRVIDLLKDLNLEDRILLGNVSYSDILSNPINWIEVEENLSLLKQRSMSFIRDSLK